MATVVVSGRVDAHLKEVVDAYLQREGVSPSDVIAYVWTQIAETGEVPVSKDDRGLERKRRALSTLEKLWSEAPRDTPLTHLTDDELREWQVHRFDYLDQPESRYGFEFLEDGEGQ